mmetsp:Transcript_43510/g.112975  ORF Transcript_43510/g.112975 Transcript_43510/m.112975 type:complete len:91 (-) Transcript_43510:221-493(-)
MRPPETPPQTGVDDEDEGVGRDKGGTSSTGLPTSTFSGTGGDTRGEEVEEEESESKASKFNTHATGPDRSHAWPAPYEPPAIAPGSNVDA